MTFTISFCGTERDMDVEAIVPNAGRGRGKDDGTRSFGVEFGALERADPIFLHGYVYEQFSRRRAT